VRLTSGPHLSVRGRKGEGEVERADRVRWASQVSRPQRERRERKKRKGVGPRLETWPSWATREGWADGIEKEKEKIRGRKLGQKRG
jgi:hypothetical protein